MLDIALHVGAVVLVLVAFGLPLVLALAPETWRRWWPVASPLFGLAGVALVQLPLGTVFSPGRTAVFALSLALIASVVTAARYSIPRPSIASLIVVIAVVPAGLMAYRPSLRLSEPRPSGVLNEDSIYYLGIDTWLKDHGVRDEPPRPETDGFFATAHAAWDNHLRVGVDLVNVETSTLLGVDPLETLPALAASLVALAGLGTALAIIALRGPPWGAIAAAVLITTRPETLRLSLDSYVAQAAGVALVPVAATALVLALVRGGWRWVATAGLFAGTLAAYYVEYAPWLALTGILLTAAVLAVPLIATARPEAEGDSARLVRRAVVVRGMSVLGLTVLLNPLAVYNGLRSLEGGSSLRGEVVVPFYGLLRDLGLVTGPFSVLYAAPEASLSLAVAAGVVLLAAMPHIPRVAVVGLGAMLIAAAAFALQQAYLQDYSYGLYKVLGLAAPLVLAGLVLALAAQGTPIGLRVVAVLVVSGLLLVNVAASLEVSRASVAGVNGMVPEDDDLTQLDRILPGVDRVALEGTDTAGTPNARQHYGVYFLRKYNGQEVTYARGAGSYYTTGLSRGRADVDRTYSTEYGGVVSWGPSLTHGDPVGILGGWHVYRRPVGPDMLLVGREGWTFPTLGPDGRTTRWTQGPASAWINADQPGMVRVSLEVAAPFRSDRLRVRIGDREVISRVVPTAVTKVRTQTFAVPRGRTILTFLSTPRMGPSGEDPLGVGVLSLRVESMRT